ncbi:TolC family protein [Ectothiorhodospira lacustris]|uniref:TolC family protein n=1 Tax=Ectothiorhodospira lacustris TaxID=2899127 RepID=UPI001EE7AF96|nr:TolC family protein [Ectothiorhodospira lacustris]MCG5501516.1 TolC family protein [Ectothiorhodospira lacustris]MCG5510867.1 TolC family protein [Ectothiorhodospira lacustris]MCG5522587.1 TolC family protein [Ectothiorhodospira lacustris]
MSRRILPLLIALCLPGAAAGADTPLPSPLTLEDALALADPAHPRLALARAELDTARAEHRVAASRNDLALGLQLNPRWVEPNDLAPMQDHDDSRAILHGRKTLHDFGRSRHHLAAAESAVLSREREQDHVLADHRLRIMQGFFEVLLADLTYTRDNEAMAVAFVELNRLRERHGLGQISDINLMAQESQYQAARLQRLASWQQTRIARQRLAALLGRPDQVPGRLRTPALAGNDRELPDVEILWTLSRDHNPRRQALHMTVEAAMARVGAERAERRPTLSAEAQAAWWQREFGGDRNPLALGLVLDIPLYDGGRVGARTAREQAGLHEARARLQDFDLSLRQAVLETWLEIQRLKIQREQARVQADYRDLYLDRSRSLYEMEVATDLGDAMTRQSEAMLFTAGTEFQLALAWARLALLTGQATADPLAPGPFSPAAMQEDDS